MSTDPIQITSADDPSGRRNGSSVDIDATEQRLFGAGVATGYAAPAVSGQRFDPFYFLRVIHKWRWTAMTVFVVILGTAEINVLLTKPRYQAHTRVLIEPERLNILQFQDVVEEDRSIEAQIAVLQSRWLARETMETLGLLEADTAPAPAAAMQATSTYEPPSAWKQALAQLPIIGSSFAEPPASGPNTAENAKIDGFLAGLSVTSGPKGLVDVRYTSLNPESAARYANAIAQEYISQNRDLHFSAVKEVSDWLAARVSEQREKVDISEEALQKFREANQLVTVEGAEDPVVARFNELTAANIKAKSLRLEKESQVNRLRAMRSDPESLQRTPQMVADPVVQQLRLELEKLSHERDVMAEKLQDRHPDMIRMNDQIRQTQARLQGEMDRVIDTLQDDARSAAAAEAGIVNSLDGMKRDASSQNRKSLQLGILEREAQSNREIYDMLMQRAREASMEKDVRPSRIRVLDVADIPRAPVSKVWQTAWMAGFIGLLLSVSLALGLEQLDNRFKTPDEIESQLGLPLLGFVPEVRTEASDAANSPVITNGVPPYFVEAIRSVRTDVLFSFTDESLKTVVVTSATLSEGKTVVASNLAIATAQAGARVLLIDGDMRRPAVHTVFKLKQEPGLSNILVGNAVASTAVQRSDIPNLWILPAGHRPPNPPELLGSARFKGMLDAFAQHFDWVFIDAPPIMPVSDARVLAQRMTGVLFVVGAERVGRQVAMQAVDKLVRVNAKIVGGVLTRVDLVRNPYYYSNYYHRRYGDYYSAAASREA